MSVPRALSFLVLAAAAAVPRTLAAQLPEGRPFSAAALEAFAAPPQESPAEGSDWHRHALAGLSGAAVGAGLGFVFSQILVGDWDEEDISANRTMWIGAGGGIGFAVGLAIGPPPRRPQEGAVPRWQQDPGRAVLTAAEIRESSARTAYDVIDSRRPDWLILRGSAGAGRTLSGTTGTRDLGGEASMDETSIPLKVYLDDMLLGGVEELRSVDAANIATIHRLNAAQATQRWGTGHTNGAIVIITVR